MGALLMTALLLLVALVIDLGFVRANRQTDKSATDFAAAAGIRSVDDDGKIAVWSGICAARDFLVANSSELSDLADVDNASLSPIPDPCSPPAATPDDCKDSSHWRTYTGLADGGRMKVIIRVGYALDASTGYQEDAGAYSGDAGTDPCEHLAVIIEEREDAKFGGIAGRSGYQTKIRSVARVDRSDRDPATAALVLLERVGCKAIEIEGSSNASITVDGIGPNPGIIHADSSGSACSGDYIYSVGVNSVTSPKVIAGRAKTLNAQNEYDKGLIAAYALKPGVTGAKPDHAYDPATTPLKVCAQRGHPVDHATDCTATSPVTGDLPTENDLVTRAPADERYLAPLKALLSSTPKWTSANRPPNTTDPTAAGYWREITNCASPPVSPIAEERVFINCNGGQWTAKGFVFNDTVRQVVVHGHLVLDGGTLTIGSPDTIYISGKAGTPGIRTAGNKARLNINTGATPAADCDARQADLMSGGSLLSRRTKLIVGAGGLETEGKEGRILLCATTLFLMDNAGTGAIGSSTGPCPLPSGSTGSAPFANGCTGKVSVKGSASLDWSAPNVTDLDPTAHLDEFEDLAFWTETEKGNVIEGSGDVELAGVFFTPNANPFRVAGSQDTSVTPPITKFNLVDAQFFTRRLQVAGGGDLVMAPQPRNAIQISVLGGFSLIR